MGLENIIFLHNQRLRLDYIYTQKKLLKCPQKTPHLQLKNHHQIAQIVNKFTKLPLKAKVQEHTLFYQNSRKITLHLS